VEAGAGGHQQLPDVRLDGAVVAFTVLDVPDLSGGVDEVIGRPVVVLVGREGGQVVVDGDGVVHAQLVGGRDDVGHHVLEGELR
jgi:hypothetical protein